MLDNGFIQIHRKINNWCHRKKPEVFSLFMHLLVNANFFDGEWNGVAVKRGQIIAGRKSLSDNLGISEQKIRTALSNLKNSNEITISTTTKYSIITIVNYDKYQLTNQINNQVIPTNKEYNIYNNNILNNIYPKEFENFWSIYPKGRKGSKEKSFKAWQKAISRGNLEDIYQGALAYSQSSEGKGKYVKGCAAWLNDDRWNNYYQREELPTDYQTAEDIFSGDRDLAEIKKEAKEWSAF